MLSFFTLKKYLFFLFLIYNQNFIPQQSEWTATKDFLQGVFIASALMTPLLDQITFNVSNFFKRRTQTKKTFTEYSVLPETEILVSKEIEEKVKTIKEKYKLIEERKIQLNTDRQCEKILTISKNDNEDAFYFSFILAQSLSLPFIEINVDNIFHFSQFEEDLQKKVIIPAIYYIDFEKITELELLFKTIHILNKNPESLLICAYLSKGEEADRYIKSFFNETVYFISLNAEQRKHYIEEYTNKYNLQFSEDLSITDLVRRTKRFSRKEIIDLLNKMLIAARRNTPDQSPSSDRAPRYLTITKKIFLDTYRRFQEDSPKKNTLHKIKPPLIPDFSFQDIGGYEKTKTELLTIAKEVLEDERQGKGILLWGPPGNGKTIFAKALAGELGLPFLTIQAADLLSKWVGESEQKIKDLFETARNHEPCVLFIDEFESLVPNRANQRDDSYKKDIVNEFLILLDALNKDSNIIFIAATNLPESIDPAILRPGRIDKKCKIDFPALKDREAILSLTCKKYCPTLISKLQKNKVAHLLDGFSGAEIEAFVRKLGSTKKVTSAFIMKTYQKIQRENTLGKFLFKKSRIGFSDIGGYKDIKESVQKEIIDILKTPAALHKKIPGCIISGPPGTGKTMLAEAIAKEANVPLIKINFSLLREEQPSSVEKLFHAIRKNRPCVVIFDEAEQLFISREEGNSLQQEFVTSFLEKTGSKDSLKGVCFVAITNYPEHIDEALKRPGRLGKQYIFKNPEFEDRTEIIMFYLKKLEITLAQEVSIKKIAERTRSMLPAQIEEFLEIAKELMYEEKKELLDEKIIAESYQQITLGKKIKNMIISDEEIKQTAYHEACHGLMTFILNRQKQGYFEFDFLTIEPRAHALGISFGRSSAEYKSLKKEMLLGLIAILLAGKAAQEVIFNQTDTGAEDDLVKATQFAEDCVKKYGMGNQLRISHEKENTNETNKEVEEILKNQYAKLKDFIKRHKRLLDKIVENVLVKKIIDEEDLTAIINQYEQEEKKAIHYRLL